jgi:hypothetical protein
MYGTTSVHCGLSTVDGVSISLSINGCRRPPRMPGMPLRRPTFPRVNKEAQRVTDLRIKRLGVRIPPGAHSEGQQIPGKAIGPHSRLSETQKVPRKVPSLTPSVGPSAKARKPVSWRGSGHARMS